jgi:hypothetical protein
MGKGRYGQVTAGERAVHALRSFIFVHLSESLDCALQNLGMQKSFGLTMSAT